MFMHGHRRCHLPLQRGELKSLVYLSSAAEDSANICMKDAMIALEQPKIATHGFNVKERCVDDVRMLGVL